MSEQGKVIDFTYLEEIAGGDAGFINEMCDLFLASMPEAVSEMKKSYENNDPVKLGEVAHKMKPSAIYMGNEELETLLKELQELKVTKEVSADTKVKLDKVDEISRQMIEEIKKR